MKKILFLPTYTYLSQNIFNELLPKFKDYEKIYIEVYEYEDWGKLNIDEYIGYDKIYSVYNNFDRLVKQDQSILRKIKKFFVFKKFHLEMQKLIKEIEPDAIITVSDMTHSIRSIKNICNNNSIPIFVVQPSFFDYGIVNHTIKNKIYYFIFHYIFRINFFNKQTTWGMEYDDIHVLVWGAYFKQILNNKKNVIVTGSPKYDKINKEKAINISDFLESNNLPINKPIVTICTEGFLGLISGEVQNKLDNIYKNLIIRNKNLFFIIKPHPRESKEAIDRIVNGIDTGNFKVINTTLRDILTITNVQISVLSNASFDAVIQHVPIALINPNNMIKLNNYFNNQIELNAKNLNELETNIYTILSQDKNIFEEKRTKYLQKMMYKIDGKSSQRVAEYIKGVID